MIRHLLFGLSVALSCTLSAQLRVQPVIGVNNHGASAGAMRLLPEVPALLLLHRTRDPAPVSLMTAPAEPAPFDFGATKPYLAFFCRLELNIEQATRFPVRFRLGEVRGWQQELSKRE